MLQDFVSRAAGVSLNFMNSINIRTRTGLTLAKLPLLFVPYLVNRAHRLMGHCYLLWNLWLWCTELEIRYIDQKNCSEEREGAFGKQQIFFSSQDSLPVNSSIKDLLKLCGKFCKPFC